MYKDYWKLSVRFLVALVLTFSILIGSLVQTSVGSASSNWRTSGTRILNPAGQPFTISGINWYGFETTSYVAHGLYTKDYKYIINEIKQYGYNTIRIPFSNQMWETNPIPNPNTTSASASADGQHSRDILAMIINYAGSVGLHVILDNHRSEAGNSAEGNGLWYASSKGKNYTEQGWISDWVGVQQWIRGIPQTLGAVDTVKVNYLASDNFPVVLGYDLRNEPHTPSRTAYLGGATWGTGDGVDPKTNPNPNPFAVPAAGTSNSRDWRLAAERAADTVLGEAAKNGWDYPLIFVEGISQYPTATGNSGSGPYDYYWWGGNLLGVNGNANNPGAPIVLNAGGNASSLGQPVYNQLVYSAHDYGPSTYKQGWFNSSTTYDSLVTVWRKFWAFNNLPNGIAPVGPANSLYPWGNTGHTAYAQAPVYIGEFGTGNNSTDLYSSGAGSEGQWFTDITNFIKASYDPSSTTFTSMNWTYWAVNTEDSAALLGSNYTGLANANKEYSFLCQIEQGPIAVPQGSGPGQCGSTGALPTRQ